MLTVCSFPITKSRFFGGKKEKKIKFVLLADVCWKGTEGIIWSCCILGVPLLRFIERSRWTKLLTFLCGHCVSGTCFRSDNSAGTCSAGAEQGGVTWVCLSISISRSRFRRIIYRAFPPATGEKPLNFSWVVEQGFGEKSVCKFVTWTRSENIRCEAFSFLSVAVKIRMCLV